MPQCSMQEHWIKACAGVRYEKKAPAGWKHCPRADKVGQQSKASVWRAPCEQKLQIVGNAGQAGVQPMLYDAVQSISSQRKDNDHFATAKPSSRRASPGAAGFELQRGGARARGGGPPFGEGDDPADFFAVCTPRKSYLRSHIRLYIYAIPLLARRKIRTPKMHTQEPSVSQTHTQSSTYFRV